MPEQQPIPTNRPRFKDLTGLRFGRLTVLSYAGRLACGHSGWHCHCDCGTELVVRTEPLGSGRTISCGCVGAEKITRRNLTHGAVVGGKRPPEYVAWMRMKVRCYNKNTREYRDYGERGIVVCERWLHSFPAFLEDMREKPSPQHSLDRIDVNGPYSPENCRWATAKEQARNARSNRLYTFNGETLCISQWAERVGLNYHCLRQRLNHGWPIKEAINTPSRS